MFYFFYNNLDISLFICIFATKEYGLMIKKLETMKRNLLTILTLFLVVLGGDAQVIDQRLTRFVERANTRTATVKKNINSDIAVFYHADGSIKSLSAIATLKSGSDCPTELLEQMGIKVRFVLGDMVALVVPVNKLKALENMEAFSYVGADDLNRIVNEAARTTTGVDQVNTTETAQEQGLPAAFTGEGVVLGVIDTGIDFNHAAFCNPDGTTRIKKAIVFTDDNELKEYSEDEISILTTDVNESHGTHTSATAGGSDTGNGQKGVATKADLFLCGLNNILSNTNIINSMMKIFEYADEVGKPAVINISLGSIIGLHDGSHAVSRAVAELTANGTKPGRAVVISSGNYAASNQTIIKKLSSKTDLLKTVMGACNIISGRLAYYNACYHLYADDYKDFSVMLKAVNITTGELEDREFHLLDESDLPTDITIDKYTNVRTAKGDYAVVYDIDFKNNKLHLDDPNYRLALIVQPGSAGQTIKMISDGSNNAEPYFDAPNNNGYDFVSAGYTKGNGDFSCITSACNDAVISVGSFVTRTSWTNWENYKLHYAPSTVTGKDIEIGAISDFSSYCVDDNGKKRPTLVAPGQGIISATNNYNTKFFVKDEPGVPNDKPETAVLIGSVEQNSRNNWYHLDHGTSMSTPHTAGIVALWMQAKPTLTTNEILEVMKETSFNDQYTTDTQMIPSGNTVQAGYGKIDCLEGLKKILGVTSIEDLKDYDWKLKAPARLNHVDAPVYDVKGQQVPNSQKGVVIYKGRKYVNS